MIASAPHARGTLDVRDDDGLLARFSPARAGNTQSTHVTQLELSLQPRTRGEHEAITMVTANMFASAPHARGTRNNSRHILPSVRFSPARAGNTLLASCCDIENNSSVSGPPTLSLVHASHL